jgi:hypothetical protein
MYADKQEQLRLFRNHAQLNCACACVIMESPVLKSGITLQSGWVVTPPMLVSICSNGQLSFCYVGPTEPHEDSLLLSLAPVQSCRLCSHAASCPETSGTSVYNKNSICRQRGENLCV